MKWWALAKQFPKYALVAGVIIGSTVAFALWWFLRPHAKPQSAASEADKAAIQKKAAEAEARVDYLFLADDDLYDAGTDELVFKNWLHGDHPIRLFYDAKAKRIIGQYDQGFVRYAFDGTRDAAMLMPLTPPAFVPGSKKIVFARGKDIWTAEIDWEAFKFVNERQATTMGIFYEPHFAENVLLLTEKTLVVRNLNNLLHINLENGSVKPMRLPPGDIGKRRSPDSKWVIGVLNGQFYCYDVDANEVKTIPIGRTGFSDFQWIGNDKCVCLSDKKVGVYDRIANTLAEAATLPFSCFKMGEPSPDGRYIFCAGGMDARNGALVDLEKKTAAQVNGGAGITWVSNDTFLYSREMPDSDLRGVWLKTEDREEKRLLSEPFLADKMFAQLLLMPISKVVIVQTRDYLVKISIEGTKFNSLTRLVKPIYRFLRVHNLPKVNDKS